MRFLNPAAFYLLGVIPLVVALHFLKLRRQPYLVSSIMFWLATDEDRRANVPFQRLRHLLLPILQVLFLLILITSIAQPARLIPGSLPGKLILIVDNTASMASAEMGPTRLTLAKQEAETFLNKVSASGGAMLMVTHAPGTYIQQAFTTDTAELRAAIADISQTHAPRELSPVFDAAARYTDSPQDEIVFISDTFENLPDMAVPVRTLAVGQTAENIAITGFNVQRDTAGYEVLMRIQNFTDTRAGVRVHLSVADIPLDDKEVSIPADETRSVLFSGDPAGLAGQVLTAHVNVTDDFPIDNSAAALLPAMPSLRILVVSDTPKSLLPDLLGSYGTYVRVTVVDPTDYHGSSDADVVFFEGSSEVSTDIAAAKTGTVFIAPGESLPFFQEEVVEIAAARVIQEDAGHPLMAGVSFQGLAVPDAAYRTLPLWGHPLVETEKGALIWVGNREDTRLLVFEFAAFDPEMSTFALTIPDAPQFVYQCLAWLEAGTAPLLPVRAEASGTWHAFRTGEPVRIAVPGESPPFHVQKPDGTQVEVETPIFTETDQVGVYTLLSAGEPLERFTVNLLNPTASELRHSPPLADIDASAGGTAALQPLVQEMWTWFACAAVLLLIVEWWGYHRSPRSLLGAGVLPQRST